MKGTTYFRQETIRVRVTTRHSPFAIRHSPHYLAKDAAPTTATLFV